MCATKKNARFYSKPYEEILILPEAAGNSSPSWFGFLITLREKSGKSRNSVTRYLEERGIQTRLLFSGNLILHPCFDTIREPDCYRVVGDLTNTNYIMNNSFWVGVYPGMTTEAIAFIGKTIIEAITV